MVITYLGGAFFKVQFGDITLAFNPVSKLSKLPQTRFFADLALVSFNHNDTNGVEQLSYNGKDAFVVSGPGEYEVKDVFVKGLASKAIYDKKERLSTIYLVTLEGMKLCFVAGLDAKGLSSEAKEVLDEVDVLFISTGAEGGPSASDMYKLAVKLEPKIIIPFDRDAHESKSAHKTFLKEAGQEDVKPIDKLTLKKKDLDGKTGEVIVLAPVI
jgi:L-ascorbate metabolism protein UlaG (beta-lactamase superfamily)